MTEDRILLVVDMQNDFITGSLGTPEARSIAPRVAQLISDGGYDSIILTKDTHTSDYLSSHEGRRLPVEHCVEFTDGWYLCREVRDALKGLPGGAEGVRILKKHGFGSIALPSMIASLTYGCGRFVVDICGVCTDICVVSNALLLRSHFPEADIRIMADACAGTTPENHEAALRVMRMCHNDIVAGTEEARGC